MLATASHVHQLLGKPEPCSNLPDQILLLCREAAAAGVARVRHWLCLPQTGLGWRKRAVNGRIRDPAGRQIPLHRRGEVAAGCGALNSLPARRVACRT